MIVGAILALPDPACAAADRVVLQLRWDHQFQFAGYYAALWQGFYAEAGLDVELRSPFASTGETLSTTDEVAAGRAQFGVGAADILLARDRGQALAVLATIFQKSGAIMLARPETELNAPADLARLRVARLPDSLIDVELQAMLRAEGIDPARVKPHPHGDTSLKNLIEGRIDVIPAYTISTSYAARLAGVPFKALRPQDYGVNFYGDSLFTTRPFAEANPDLVRRFVAASLRGWAHALENPEPIAERIVAELPTRTQWRNLVEFQLSQIEPVRELTLYPIVQLGHVNPDRWAAMHRQLAASGLVKAAFDAESFIFDPEEEERTRALRRLNYIEWTVQGLLAAIVIALGLTLIQRRVVARVRRTFRESEARYRQLIDLTPDGIYIVVDGTVTFANPAALAIFGATAPEQLIGRSAFDLFDPTERERIMKLRTTIDTKRAVVNERDLKAARLDGTPIFVKTLGTKVNWEGRQGYLVVVHDVTERRRTEEELRVAKRVLEVLIDACPVAIVRQAQDGAVTLWNRAAEALFGWSEAEVLGRQVPYIGDAQESARGRLREAVLAGEIVKMPAVTRQKKDGSPVELEIHSAPIRDATDKIDGFVTMLVDITDRRRAEAEAARVSRLFESLIAACPLPVFVHDMEGIVSLWNPSAESTFGWTAAETIGKPIPYFGPEGHAPLKAILTVQRDTGAETLREVRRYRKDGTPIDLEIRSAPLRGEAGALVGYLAVAIDITERKRAATVLNEAKEAAEVANRSKSEFLANMSHELRTPLNAIIGFSEVIKGEIMGPLANSRYRDYAADIHRSGAHLLQLINDILDLSKIEAGKMEINADTIDLAATIESCVRIIAERAESRHIAIDVRCRAGLPAIVADERKLRQVLLNLLSNSVKFTPEGGAISVAVDRAGEAMVTIAVSDNGIGMRTEDIPVALAPFGQVDSRLNRKYEGTGLGLPLAKRLVELHGGRLAIASAPGAGTTVSVTLPTSRRAA